MFDPKLDTFTVKIQQKSTKKMHFKQNKPQIRSQTHSHLSHRTNSPHNNSFLNFMRDRFNNGHNGFINLGVLDLHEIIELCKKEDIIQQKLYEEFIQNYDYKCRQNFHALYQGQISRLDFSNSRFCLIDHRFYCQRLIEENNVKYRIFNIPVCYSNYDNDYLKKIYSLSFKQYLKIFDQFNSEFQRNWMTKSEAFRWENIVQMSNV